MLRFAMEHRGSDLHLKVGSPPHVRVDGHLMVAPFDTVTAAPAATLQATWVVPLVLGFHQASYRQPFVPRKYVSVSFAAFDIVASVPAATLHAI